MLGCDQGLMFEALYISLSVSWQHIKANQELTDERMHAAALTGHICCRSGPNMALAWLLWLYGSCK